jgi:hypothetical protein
VQKGDVTWSAELRYQGEYGVEAQILRSGDLRIATTFVLRDLAVGWAKNERDRLEGDDPFAWEPLVSPHVLQHFDANPRRRSIRARDRLHASRELDELSGIVRWIVGTRKTRDPGGTAVAAADLGEVGDEAR